MSIDDLLPYLVCPVSRGRLDWYPAEHLLVSARAGLAYPVRDGVPVLIPEQAIVWPRDGQGVPIAD